MNPKSIIVIAVVALIGGLAFDYFLPAVSPAVKSIKSGITLKVNQARTEDPDTNAPFLFPLGTCRTNYYLTYMSQTSPGEWLIFYDAIACTDTNGCPRSFTVTSSFPPAITLTNEVWTVTFNFAAP